MGSAVGAVTGMVGGVMGEGIGGLVNGILPGAKLADQDSLNNTIYMLQQNGQINQAQADQMRQQAAAQYGNVQGAIGQANQGVNLANQAIGGAQQANQVVGGDALGILRGAATGMAPSAAQAQLQAGKDQAIATQSALANSGNLSQMIGGQKTAMDNAANLTQQAANQSAQLRANEMATARGQYGTQASNYAGQAGTNAGLQLGAANTQAGLANTQAGLYNNQLQAGLGYSNAANSSLGQAGNQALGAQGLQQGALNQEQAQKVDATQGMMNGLGGMLASGLMSSDEKLKNNVTRDQRAKSIADSFKEQKGDKKPDSKKEEEPKKEAEAPEKDQDAEDRKQETGGRIKDSFSSDERKKDHVSDRKSMLHEFLSKIDPVTFEYKEEVTDGQAGRTPGTHMGVIAQQVEKAPGGDSMVHDTAQGKMIDIPSAVGMLMSAAADSHDRVATLEELLKSKRSKK